MSLQPQEKLITVDEFEAFIARPENRHRRFQLIQGEIVEKLPTQLHGYIALAFTAPLFYYAKQNPIGHVYSKAHYRAIGDTNNDRIPDISFSTHPTIVDKGPAAGMPDLAIEIQSPDDELKDMIDNAHFYLANGSKMVCLVISDKRLMMVITPDGVQILTEKDSFDGGTILPGFSLPLVDIFPPPHEFESA